MPEQAPEDKTRLGHWFVPIEGLQNVCGHEYRSGLTSIYCAKTQLEHEPMTEAE
jgi:hypothetical protein